MSWLEEHRNHRNDGWPGDGNQSEGTREWKGAQKSVMEINLDGTMYAPIQPPESKCSTDSSTPNRERYGHNIRMVEPSKPTTDNFPPRRAPPFTSNRQDRQS